MQNQENQVNLASKTIVSKMLIGSFIAVPVVVLFGTYAYYLHKTTVLNQYLIDAIRQEHGDKCPKEYTLKITSIGEDLIIKCISPHLTQTECRKDLQSACDEAFNTRAKFCKTLHEDSDELQTCYANSYSVEQPCGKTDCLGTLILDSQYFHDEL